jgi:hypothetical protein
VGNIPRARIFAAMFCSGAVVATTFPKVSYFPVAVFPVRSFNGRRFIPTARFFCLLVGYNQTAASDSSHVRAPVFIDCPKIETQEKAGARS